MSFELAIEIIEKYKPRGIMDTEDAIKIIDYCIEAGCDKCELKKHYSQCPVAISLGD